MLIMSRHKYGWKGTTNMTKNRMSYGRALELKSTQETTFQSSLKPTGQGSKTFITRI